MLTFKQDIRKSYPIAVVNEDDFDFDKMKILYYKDTIDEVDVDFDPLEYINDDMFYDKKERHQMKATDMNKIIRALKYNENIQDAHLIEPLKKIRENIEKKKGKEIILKHGTFQFIPNHKTTDSSRHCILVSGASGSGKSYWTADYANQYIKMFPKYEVFVFSKKEEDPAFDRHKKIKRIILDETFLEDEPLSYKDFTNSLVIFDDVDTIDGEIGKSVTNLRSDILQLGRANNVSCVVTTHILCNGSKTKELINEATHYVFFKGCNKLNTGRLLKTYIGIDDKQSKEIFKLPSRWVLISKIPVYVMYSTGCYLID
jgi:hypothetical protein